MLVKALAESVYEWVHWSAKGLYLFGWRINTYAGFAEIERRSIEKGIDPKWMYRRMYSCKAFNLKIFWSKREKEKQC